MLARFLKPERPERGLEVHVINGGYGESIILHLPTGDWGVIDCYAGSLRDTSSNPTLQFLVTRDVRELAFLCLTHPHDDHYRGMSHLMSHLTVRSFWRSGAMSPQRLYMYLRGDAVQRRNTDQIENAEDLKYTLLEVYRRSQARQLTIEPLAGVRLIQERQIRRKWWKRPLTLRIVGIAPSGRAIEAYEAGLNRCLDQAGRLQDMVPALKHNGISVGLLITYGNTSVVLGGDVEGEAWTDALADEQCPDLSASFVKVSHHGSPTGYCDGLWERFCRQTRSVAVITPSRRHSLPTEAAVDHIRSHTDRLLSTCPPAHTFSVVPRDVFWDDFSASVRFGLRMGFTSYRKREQPSLGMCSLYSDGNASPRIECSGVAGPLL
jgi:beta-lactamase superfamily II metal-dependent hydrolase